MLYSYRIEQAIRAAALLHRTQVRKGPVPLPYVTHLFAVAFILSDYTDDEDVIIAGLLHDTLEDTEYSEEELREDFGRRVFEIVRAVSEQTEGEKGPWKERKKAYAKQLTEAPQEALMVSCADKIHNMRSTIEGYYGNHEGFLRELAKPSVEDQVWFHQTVSNILNRRLKNDIVHEFNHVFTEYKKFALNEDR
ncbi:HD domain-containing protein [Candidatus Kaiserbacteria bacterium]|nr:HD domain-containing protein [Candidatus Kaiserbacteria bacterium]